METSIIKEMKDLLKAIEKLEKDPLQIIYDKALKYFKKKLSINIPIKINWLKSSKDKIFYGGVDLLKFLKEGKAVIDLEKDISLSYTLKGMVHELTHIKQMIKKELSVNNEFVLWNGKPIISIENYRNNKDYNVWKELPWEIDADKDKVSLSKEFINSKDFISLGETNSSIKFIIDMGIKI